MSPSPRRARAAITAVFALNGSLFASIFSRLPAIRERTELSEGELGLALLCSMVGLLAAQPAAGALASRLGSRPIVLAGACGYAIGLVPVALSESFLALALALALVGTSNGFLDLAMNVHGLTVERRLGRPILSTLHAAFSFGALGGAGAGAIVAGAGLGVTTHLPAAAAAGVLLALLLSRELMPRDADVAKKGPRLAAPNRALFALGVFAFCVLLSEGAVNDWVAVYLAHDLGARESVAALGLAAFALTMGVGRLLGDRLTERHGAGRLAMAGAAAGAVGAAVGVTAPTVPVAIGGFALTGAGLAALFPLAVRAASADQGAPGVAAISATGYTGFLAGPPLVGGLAELGGLRLGLAAVAVLCLVATRLARTVEHPAYG